MSSRSVEEYYQVNRVSILNYGKCSLCDRALENGEPLTAGWTETGKMELACAKCKASIKDIVREMSFFKQEYEVPPAETKLWRYIDFTKFVSLLETGELYFTRADKFEDPFEGARGFQYQSGEAYQTIEQFRLLEIKARIQQSGSSLPPDAELKRMVSDEMTDVREKYKKFRERVFISCWHANERESEGMWKLYTSVMSQGVAIQTTVEHLCNSICDANFNIGRVKYISFEKPLNIHQKPYWYKRDAFKHEDEVRVVIIDENLKKTGKAVRVSLDSLIDKIYISPSAQSWFAGLVTQICKRYSLDRPVVQSALIDYPLY